MSNRGTARKQRQKLDVYQMVTDRIIEALEQGTIPWFKTWQGLGSPKNYVTKHVYSGINALITNLSPYDIPCFLTLKQANELGGKVRKGSRSLPIVYWTVSYKDENGKFYGEEINSEEEGRDMPNVQKLFLARYYQVFNIADVEGVDFNLPFLDYDFDPIPTCEQMIDHMPDAPEIRFGGNNAYYVPSKDYVKVPFKAQFNTPEDYYFTLFHELVHSTGHEKRLNRPGIMEKTKFGDIEYSQEELIAEIGASFLSAIAGIENPALVENSHAYIAGWLGKLRDDKQFVFKATKEAKKAVECVVTEK